MNFHEHHQIENLISIFGTLFDDMTLSRRDRKTGKLLQVIHPVPLEYAPRDKFLSRLDKQEIDNGSLKEKYHVIYPKMSYEMTNMNLALDRTLPRQERFLKNVENGRGKKIDVPVGYDVGFDLHIASKNAGDVHQLVEQILPEFRPQKTISMKDFPVDGETYDLPIIFNGLSWEDEYEGSLEDGIRRVTFTLSFVAQYRFFGPAGTDEELEVLNSISKTSNVIKPVIEKARIRQHGKTYGYYLDENVDVEYVENADGTSERIES